MLNLKLPDGRRLEYICYGDEKGFPVVFCHGFPASHHEASLFTSAAMESGVSLIVADRPGTGGSGYQPDRRIPGWAGDVAHLCDHLGLDRYSVVGISGGAPYALSCGVSADPRLHRLGIICGLGPLVKTSASRGMGVPARMFIASARRFPSLAISFNSLVIGPLMYRFPQLAVMVLNSAAPPCDKAVFKDPALRKIYLQSFRTAFEQGGRGPAWDLYLYTHPWGFDPDDVKVDTYLWHGELDRTVPVETGRNYAARLPHCKAEFIPGEGHFSLPIRIMKTVLLSLKADAG